MTFIPDTRRLVNTMFNKGKPNGYYEGYLNDKDASYVAGFDWVVDYCLKNYFSDTQDLLDDITENLSMATDNDKLCDLITNLSDNDKNILALAIKNAILDRIEIERDELITSMIDSMSDEEYESFKKKFEEGHRNDVLRQLNSLNITDENGNYIDEDYIVD